MGIDSLVMRQPLLIGALAFLLALPSVFNAQAVDAIVDRRQDEREFAVYFPQEGSALTDEALAVVREAMNFFRGNAPARVEIWGHADRLGTRRYNMRLSRQRAVATAQAFIDLGVPSQTIRTVWSGETQIPHPTNDEVYLPLNRVAVIKITGIRD